MPDPQHLTISPEAIAYLLDHPQIAHRNLVDGSKEIGGGDAGAEISQRGKVVARLEEVVELFAVIYEIRSQ